MAGLRTVAAGLYGGFDVADALHRDAVLVVAVDELVLQLADFVEEDAQLIGHVGYVFVAGLAPVGQLLLRRRVSPPGLVRAAKDCTTGTKHTATSMRSLAHSSRLRMRFFSILTSCVSFLDRSGPKAPAVLPRSACPVTPDY